MNKNFVFSVWRIIFSSNINEVIRPVLNFFFYKKISQVQKKKKKHKNVYKKHLSSNIKSLRQFRFLTNFL